jgi:hypothetical protein
MKEDVGANRLVDRLRKGRGTEAGGTGGRRRKPSVRVRHVGGGMRALPWPLPGGESSRHVWTATRGVVGRGRGDDKRGSETEIPNPIRASSPV